MIFRRSRQKTSQSGNVFALLFGAVALTGALAAVSMQTITGPIQTATKVTQSNMIESNLLTNAQLVVLNAATLTNNGDADNDSFIEPTEYIPNGTSGCVITFTGGGCLPSTFGASITDPYGTAYGYCVWDHGSTDGGHADGALAALGATVKRLNGSLDSTDPVILIVSAGPDKTFQTSCLAYDGSGNDGPQIVTTSDDIVFQYTYAEASAATGGLWTLDPADGTKAEISKDIQLRDASNDVQASITNEGFADFLGVTTDLITAKTGPEIKVDGNLEIVNEATWAIAFLTTYSDSHNSSVILRRARGTEAAPTFPLSGDGLGTFQARSHSVSGVHSGAGMYTYATENHAASNQMGTELRIASVPNGTQLAVSRINITHDGDIGMGEYVADPNDVVHISRQDGEEGHVGLFIQDPTVALGTMTGGRLYYDDRSGRNDFKLSSYNAGVETGYLSLERASGFVGINTVSPDGALTINAGVAGSTNEDALVLQRNLTDPQSLIFGQGSGGHRITGYSDPANAKPLTISVTTNATNDPVTSGSANITFTTMGNTRMRIDQDGGVRIGNDVTAAPLTDLHVEGDILINGNNLIFNHDGATDGNNDYMIYSDTNDEIVTGNGGTFILHSDVARGLTDVATPTAGIAAHSVYIAERLGIGDITPAAPLDIENDIFFGLGGGNTSVGPDIQFDQSGLIASTVNMLFNIDSDDTSTTAEFVFHKDDNKTGGSGVRLMELTESGILTVFGSGTTCVIGNGTGNTSCTSDKRLKKDIKTFENPFDVLMASRGVRYKWNEKAGKNYDQEMIGVIAQEVQAVLPEIVQEDKDTGYLSVSISGYIPVLIEAMKELKTDSDALKSEREVILDKSKDQEQRLAVAEEKINKLLSNHHPHLSPNNNTRKD